jgi:DNA-binding CsgD family transcriptional regulator
VIAPLARAMLNRSLMSFDDVASRALDALDQIVIAMSADMQVVLHLNGAARKRFPDGVLPRDLRDAAQLFVISRRDTGRTPAPMKVELGAEAEFLCVIPAGGNPPVEVLVLRPEVTHAADTFRLLNGRYGVTRREFQVLGALRRGLTNREIASRLGISPNTIARHLQRLYERLDVPNRSRLVGMVERLSR